jgi:hypothetical protein
VLNLLKKIEDYFHGYKCVSVVEFETGRVSPYLQESGFFGSGLTTIIIPLRGKFFGSEFVNMKSNYIFGLSPPITNLIIISS